MFPSRRNRELARSLVDTRPFLTSMIITPMAAVLFEGYITARRLRITLTPSLSLWHFSRHGRRRHHHHNIHNREHHWHRHRHLNSFDSVSFSSISFSPSFKAPRRQ